MFIELFICNPNDPDNEIHRVPTLFNLDYIGLVQPDQVRLDMSRITYEVASPEPNAQTGSIEFLIASSYADLKSTLAGKIYHVN